MHYANPRLVFDIRRKARQPYLQESCYAIDRVYPPRYKRLRSMPYTIGNNIYPGALVMNGQGRGNEFPNWDRLEKHIRNTKLVVQT